MFSKKIYTVVLIAALIMSCNTKDKHITNTKDYNKFLALAENQTLNTTKKDNKFWEEKLDTEKNQFPYNFQ